LGWHIEFREENPVLLFQESKVRRQALLSPLEASLSTTSRVEKKTFLGFLRASKATTGLPRRRRGHRARCNPTG